MPNTRYFALAWLLAGCAAHAQTTVYRDLGLLQKDLGASLCSIEFSADGVLKASEVNGVNFTANPLNYSGPGPNTGLGSTLSFDQSPPFFNLQALESGAGLTFDDDEDAGNLPSFDNALSIGDINNQENDDFRVTFSSPQTAFGFFLNDNNGQAGESLRLMLDAGGTVLDSFALSAVPSPNHFIGVITSEPVFGFEFDEDAGGDDIALSALFFQNCDGPDSYEPDNLPDQGRFIEDFDFITDEDVVVEQVRNLDSAGDVDWTIFQTTYNYPTNPNWSGATPNTQLYVQLCQGACDGNASVPLNLQMFNFDLVANPASATPVFELNACSPGVPNDEVERELPNFTDDETLFVRVSACDGSENVDYRLLLRRFAVGIDLHVVRGTVSLFDQSGQLVPAPAYAVITSNYNDFTFADPADGSFAIAMLARGFQSGVEITDLELTVQLFNAPFEASQTKPVRNMVAAEEQEINFLLNLFRDGFESPSN